MTGPDRIALAVLRAFGRRGRLELLLPDGERAVIGVGEPSADLEVVDREVYGATLREGSLGFLEAYVAGAVKTSDVRRLMSWAAANHANATTSSIAALTAPVRHLWQRIAPKRGDRRVATMADHYNLGNDFYEAWLDPTMTYSSARFARPGFDLETAQLRKYEAIADHAGLEPGMRVLEIGCGWGGFAMYAARERGVEVVGLTIADEQARYARKRIAEAGLTDRIEIRLEDFRDTEGRFDAVVSIEMIESVDETVWPSLFAAIHDRLAPGGRAVMQAITIEDARFDGYRRRQDFIQRYIFPGGQVPAPTLIARLADDHRLETDRIEMFGLDYAETLRVWYERFEAAWPDIVTKGYDERFRRIWQLYLTYCEAGFRSGTIDVGQWVFRRG